MNKRIGKVNICDNPYTISVRDVVGDKNELAGQIRYYEYSISIRDKLIKPAAISVLGHEIAHGVMVEGGANEIFTDVQKEVVADIAGKVASIMFKHKDVVSKLIDSVGVK